MNRNGILGLCFHVLFIGFVCAPLVMVVLVSFTAQSFLSLPTNGLSLRWFAAIGENREFISSFWISLGLGLVAATIAVILSLPAALAISRYRFIGRDALLALFLSPLLIPHVVLGVAFLRFYSITGFVGTLTGLVVAHAIVVIPYAIRMVLASVNNIDSNAERAAASLGATPWTTFVRVTLPLMIPGIAGGWVISFLQSFDEVTMSVFLASPNSTTLPVRLLHYMTDTIDPLVASISTVVIVITFLLMVIVNRLYGLERFLVGRG